MNKSDKFFLTGVVIFVITFITFFGYHNFNLYPEKKHCTYTIEVQYQSGRNVVKQYELPKGTKFWIGIQNHKYGQSNTYLKYNFHKPFGNERGYIAFDIDDYKIISVKEIK